MMKRNSKGNFRYNFLKYIIVIILPVIIWHAVFYFVYRTRDNERVKILFWGDGLDTAALNSALAENISDIAGGVIEYAEIRSTTVDKSYISAYQAIYDIIIFSDDFMAENIGQNYGFFCFNAQGFADIFGEGVIAYTEKYNDSILYYAVELSGSCVFAQYCTGERKCYMFFSSESVNLGDFNGNGNEEDDAALKVAQYFTQAG